MKKIVLFCMLIQSGIIFGTDDELRPKRLTQNVKIYVEALYAQCSGPKSSSIRPSIPQARIPHVQAQEVAKHLMRLGYSKEETKAILLEIQPEKGSAWRENFEKWQCIQKLKNCQSLALYLHNPGLRCLNSVTETLQNFL